MKKEDVKKKRRKLKFKFKVILFILVIIFYSIFIGTKGIFIKDYTIKNNKITKEMNGIKILQFSDLSYGSSVNIKDVKNIANKINEAEPDIVIFTGDLIKKNKDLNNETKQKLIKYLSNINAEYGKYYITGEDDTKVSKEILNKSNFVYLNENIQNIYITNKNYITLLSNSNVNEYLENNDYNNSFNILSLHNTNNFYKFKKCNIDMVIAGHTNNGQINIPYIKDLFINSKYNKSYQKVNNTRIYVNPGIGTKKVHARLFNHPTMYLYRINKPSN